MAKRERREHSFKFNDALRIRYQTGSQGLDRDTARNLNADLATRGLTATEARRRINDALGFSRRK